MTTVTFDTHEFFTQLKNVGFSEQQAEVITKLQKEAVSVTLEQARHDYELDNIASKRDLKEMENLLRKDIEVLRKEIELVRADTKRDIAETKADLIRWVVGVGLLQITIIAGLVFRLTEKV